MAMAKMRGSISWDSTIENTRQHITVVAITKPMSPKNPDANIIGRNAVTVVRTPNITGTVTS